MCNGNYRKIILEIMLGWREEEVIWGVYFFIVRCSCIWGLVGVIFVYMENVLMFWEEMVINLVGKVLVLFL